jgi:hypothetical protein
MKTLTLTRRPSLFVAGGLSNSFWGPRSVMICAQGLRRHTDVSKDALEIEAVVLKAVNADEPELFDINRFGSLEGVGQLDCDFQRWLRKSYHEGYRTLYINEVTTED